MNVPLKRCYDHADLGACLVEGLAGAFQSRAAKQMLGSLSKATPADAHLMIAKVFQSPGVGMCAVWSTYEAGKVNEYVLLHSTAELWEHLRKSHSSHSHNKDIDAWQGRLIQIRILPPIVALQLLTALRSEFDVEFLFSQLISRGSVGGGISHAGGHAGIGKRWFFTIKYYYLNDGRACSYEGQESGPLHEKASGLYICRGTSNITVDFRVKDSGTSGRKMWTCLVLSTNQQVERMQIDFANHTEAFLWALGQEVSWARRELRRISQQIALLAVPSDDFLFNDHYRDSLLFENSNYSNSKTYFWALQSLRAVNDCISRFLTTWESFESFSLRDFLRGQGEEGSNSASQGPKGQNVAYLNHIGEEVSKLRDLQASNLARQEEIESLRDGLFNASTVLEARTTVLQGRNIELLTYISMIFLPASFVTSVFGMDILSSSVKIRDFAIIFVAVCGVTYATILLFRLMHPFKRSRVGQNNSDEVQYHGNGNGASRTPFWFRPFEWTRRARDADSGVDAQGIGQP